MNYRSAKLLDAEDVGASGTKVVPVEIKDIISRINISFKTTKAQQGMNSYAHKNITKIELVDGSDRIFSMDGGECQALCIYDRRCPTMSHGQHLVSCSEWDNYGLDFGRYLFDPELALDPNKFNNPQLKITYDEDVADTSVTANEMEIIADCFDEKIVSPIGFLMSKELYSYTCGAENSYEQVDVPVDFPIRKLLVMGYRSGYEPWNVISEARLSEDNLKRIPFDVETEPYYRRMKGIWSPIIEDFQGLADASGTYTFYITPTDYYLTAGFASFSGGYIHVSGVRAGGSFTPYSNSGDQQFNGILKGFLPNHCFEFPFGDPMKLDDWYDVTLKGSVKLRLKAGGSGANGTGAVITQQLRRYLS